MNSPRIGHGYDVHAYAQGDGFVLGGVHIPADRTIVAHSDGDVLIHALCDALLGAIGQGDIGHLFPDDDPQNENRDSREFLREVKRRQSCWHRISLAGSSKSTSRRRRPRSWDLSAAKRESRLP